MQRSKQTRSWRRRCVNWFCIPGTPFGMLPVLEIDGKPMAQSNAVARYLAKQYGLAGKDEWESLQCDVLVDTLGDLKQGINCVYVIEIFYFYSCLSFHRD